VIQYGSNPRRIFSTPSSCMSSACATVTALSPATMQISPIFVTCFRAGPEEIGNLVKSSNIELARQEYNAFLKNTSPNFRFGVVSGLLVRLNPWVNKRIAALTEVTDFDPTTLKDQLFTFYFVTLHQETPIQARCSTCFQLRLRSAPDRRLQISPHPLSR